jgi:hypothetical protein
MPDSEMLGQHRMSLHQNYAPNYVPNNVSQLVIHIIYRNAVALVVFVRMDWSGIKVDNVFPFKNVLKFVEITN